MEDKPVAEPTINLTMGDLDRLIAERMDAMKAEEQKRAIAAARGATPGCNCDGEGWIKREAHQFGCPWADPKGSLAIENIDKMWAGR